MEQILNSISSFLWGAPVLILLAAVGLLFGIKTKFFQCRKFGYILKNTAGETRAVDWEFNAWGGL